MAPLLILVLKRIKGDQFTHDVFNENKLLEFDRWNKLRVCSSNKSRGDMFDTFFLLPWGKALMKSAKGGK
jgi:hypothetical protein